MQETPPHTPDEARQEPGTAVTLARLFAYPVKSCAGVELDAVELTEAGLDLDRAWMAVDQRGDFVSQRQLPRMALIRCQIRSEELVLRAPGMLALHLAINAVEKPVRVQVWDDSVPAFDMGNVAAQWFSDFLGHRLRLVRFDPEHRRLSQFRWTAGLEAPNQFSDGYPLLVVSQASLDSLNMRLTARGHAAVGLERFRPNLVLSGVQAHEEDFIRDVRLFGADGPVTLRLVKPCARCPIPDIDPCTAERSTAVGDTLATYRADPRLDGALTFGMNAIVLEGDGVRLQKGLPGSATWRFD